MTRAMNCPRRSWLLDRVVTSKLVEVYPTRVAAVRSADGLMAPAPILGSSDFS